MKVIMVKVTTIINDKSNMQIYSLDLHYFMNVNGFYR
jgi:hypothetical protein